MTYYLRHKIGVRPFINNAPVLSFNSQVLNLQNYSTKSEKTYVDNRDHSQFQVKATMPKMDRNGYFIYSAATAKKKKISLMQPRPPREAFVEEKCARRPGFAQRVGPIGASSVGSASARDTHPSDMNRSARLHSQLECYQPRYHTIRETPVTERKVHPQDCDGRVKSVRKSGRDSGSPKHQAREYQSPSNFR